MWSTETILAYLGLHFIIKLCPTGGTQSCAPIIQTEVFRNSDLYLDIWIDLNLEKRPDVMDLSLHQCQASHRI